MTSIVGGEGSIDYLRSVKELAGCTQSQLEEVARLAERVTVGAGEVLTKEGRIGREFFFILSGSVAVTRNGRRVSTLGPGDFFGELAAVNPGPRNATVTALSEMEVLIIGPREFAAMGDIPGFRESLLRGMVQRLRQADASLDEALDREGGVARAPRSEP